MLFVRKSAQKKFAKLKWKKTAKSKNKKLVYFEKGGHSLLRITDMNLYDGSIGEFLNTYFLLTCLRSVAV